MTQGARLTRDDWVAGALLLCAEEGYAKVAVEPLAARLGATKGSFYWHFRSRDDLLSAMLAAWEREHTMRIIDQVEEAPPPDRLRRLIADTFGVGPRDRGSRLERAMLAAADRPEVAPVVAGVHRARIGYLDSLFRALGFPAQKARIRAWTAYAAFLGDLQLSTDRQPTSKIDTLVDELVVMFSSR
ncbi:TetR/AcrR family transcriptional regulator [Naumannella sp. ID2617S]|nr:TetR/AcrR family transcriptional regulator [Naumannella sp. ID2617S]